MSTRRLQQSTISFTRNKGNSPAKESSQKGTEDTQLQCPVCGKFINKSIIEEHIEQCLSKSQDNNYIEETPLKRPHFDEHIQQSTPSPIKTTLPSSVSSIVSEKSSGQSISPDKTTKSSTSTPLRKIRNERRPLADRLRPTNFKDLIGNSDLFGEHQVIRNLLENDPPPSIILFGPPGCGKTTIATIISQHTKCSFKSLSCCTAGIKDIKEIAEKAENEYRLRHLPTILFMDEIHRFNKSQQDIFLPYVENGLLILIGATTENPSFSINSALLSRCQVIALKGLSIENLTHVLQRALQTDSILQASGVIVNESLLQLIARKADGDARKALNLLDACCSCACKSDSKEVTIDMIDSNMNQRFVRYDKNGEEHHNIISAFQKSIRGSDIQAAIYWLGRMIEGGEDPLYIARRLVVMASEEIGLADPQALLIANATYQACHEIGLPECNLALTECTAYLALASKSNEIMLAYDRVKELIHEGENPPVPLHIRNAPIESMEDLGYGIGYQYGYNKNQTYLPKQYLDKKFIDVNRAVMDVRSISFDREDLNEKKNL